MSKILFAGTPDISVPFLKALAASENVVGVLTACDKPQGRSSVPVPSPVKVAANELGIPVLQFESLRTDARKAVKLLGADVLVSFAYGKIFGPMFLAMFDHTFNIHPSRLPQFRGPSPIQSTILNGLKEAAISVQVIGEKMDEGAIYDCIPVKISGTETTESLTELIAAVAAEKVPSVISNALSGCISPHNQTGEVSYCNLIDKSMAHLDFSCTAMEIHSKIRALYPWPKAICKADDKDIFITGVWGTFEDLENEPALDNVSPGTVVGLRKDRGLGIACSDKVVWINSFQLPGKKELDFKSFVNGNSWVLKALFS